MKSWGWSLTLNAPVADQGSVDVPTPDYDAALTNADSVELTIGNDVIDVPEQATVAFNGPAATVTNLTGGEWAQGELVYIYAEARNVTGEGAGDALADLQNQINAHDGRISALETSVTDLEARVAALETAAGAARSVPVGKQAPSKT